MLKKITLFLFAFTLFACSKTVESESKSWQRNTKIIQDLKVEYPNFSKQLEAQLSKAQQVYEEADKITDEEAKIAQLEKANKTLNTEFVRNLRAVERMRKEVREVISKLEPLKVGNEVYASKSRAIREAEAAIRQADQLPQAQITDLTIATSVSRKAKEALENADKAMDEVIAIVEKAEREAKKAKEAAQKKKKDELAAQFVTCEYCNTKNKAASAKCSSCGAALPKK